MKKSLIAIVVVVLCITCVSVMASCDNDKKDENAFVGTYYIMIGDTVSSYMYFTLNEDKTLKYYMSEESDDILSGTYTADADNNLTLTVNKASGEVYKTYQAKYSDGILSVKNDEEDRFIDFCKCKLPEGIGANPSSSAVDNDVVGTYYMLQYEPENKLRFNIDLKNMLIFKQDMTFEMNAYGDRASGAYTNENGTISFTVEGMAVSAAYKDGVLTMKVNADFAEKISYCKVTLPRSYTPNTPSNPTPDVPNPEPEPNPSADIIGTYYILIEDLMQEYGGGLSPQAYFSLKEDMTLNYFMSDSSNDVFKGTYTANENNELVLTVDKGDEQEIFNATFKDGVLTVEVSNNQTYNFCKCKLPEGIGANLPSGDVDNDVIGTYYLLQYRPDDNWFFALSLSNTLTLKQDMSFDEVTAFGQKASGTYTIENGTITLTYDGRTITLTYKDGVLSSTPDGGYPQTIYYCKAILPKA